MRNYAENGELCGIVRRTENCAISHSPHLNVASEVGTILHEKQKNPYILEGLSVGGSSVEIRGSGSGYLTLSEFEVYTPQVDMGKF